MIRGEDGVDNCFNRRGFVVDCEEVVPYEEPSAPWCVNNENQITGEYCEAAVMI